MKIITEFFISGHPMPAGSKKFVGMNKKTGRALIVDQSGHKGKVWRDVCQKTAKLHYQGPLIEEAMDVDMIFFLPRPKNHFNSKGGLKKSAPWRHIVKPDKTKLGRAVEDAMTGVIWKDDSRIVRGNVGKEYGPFLGTEEVGYGCFISVKVYPSFEDVLNEASNLPIQHYIQ